MLSSTNIVLYSIYSLYCALFLFHPAHLPIVQSVPIQIELRCLDTTVVEYNRFLQNEATALDREVSILI